MAWIQPHGNKFIVRWRDKTGKQNRSFETEEQAQAFKLEIERKVYRQSIVQRVDKSQTSLSSIAKDYLDSLNVAPISKYSYRRSTFAPFLEFFKDRTITSITSIDVNSYFTWRRTKVMSSTASRDYSVLKRFFRWAKHYFLMPENPFDLVRVRRVTKSPGICLSYEQMVKIMDNVTPYQRCKILLARDCGLRATNIGALYRNGLDFEARTVTFHVLKKGEDRLNDAETRTLPMTRRLCEALIEQRFEAREPHALLFTYQEKGLRDPNKFLKRLKPKVGFQFRWHDFRHTFYTRLLEATDNYAMAEWALGHRITYWHPTPEKLKAGFRLMEEKTEQGLALVRAKKFGVMEGGKQ